MSEALPPMTDAPISVLLLDCASAGETQDVIAAWRDQLTDWQRSFEIIVVGSEANAEIERLRDNLLAAPQARIVTYAGGEAAGPALIAALQAASHPLLLFSTADKQYRPKDA